MCGAGDSFGEDRSFERRHPRRGFGNGSSTQCRSRDSRNLGAIATASPEIVRAINPAKDVDGFHPENVAKLALEDSSGFVPCTPAGCMRLIKAAGVETSGAEAVVVGRSMIVGKPMALLLMARGIDATVTVAHSRTRDLAEVCRRADILVAAVGIPEFIREDFVKEGATVIDVGINRVEDASKKRGYRLCGDVAFNEVAEKAGAITPVPGGVGPMTIAHLMKNTIKAAKSMG
jgi:methylenetetrahydrofolate dehydrogenase (NADP+)/methenyltetrahydrofolate cyclohydrolase